MNFDQTNVNFIFSNPDGGEDINFKIDLLDCLDKILSFPEPIQGIKDWFLNEHSVSLTTSQALKVKLGVTQHFMEFKKKLCREHELPIGTLD